MFDGNRAFDLICVGRCAVDLYCDQIGVPLAKGKSLSMYMGGCSTNVAIGAARLGLNVALLTHVGCDETGDFAVETLAREGVDVSHVIRDPQARTPINIASIQPPDRFTVTYYRENAGDLRVTADDVTSEWLAAAKALLITGNSLVTPDSAGEIVQIARAAKAVGTAVVYDIDFRRSLWSGSDDEIRRTLQSPLCCTGRRWLRARRPELYEPLLRRTGRELHPIEARFSDDPVSV
jgi:5-dehydro-2-deoxygluconokinase